jgi:hypothetical protein
MNKWPGAFPIFVKSASGAHFTDVDGRDYVDLCLGDTAAMTGHSPQIVAGTVARRVCEGLTFMLPTEDALWVGEDLQRRFGLPFWQFTLTATDANRFSIPPHQNLRRSHPGTRVAGTTLVTLQGPAHPLANTPFLNSRFFPQDSCLCPANSNGSCSP